MLDYFPPEGERIALPTLHICGRADNEVIQLVMKLIIIIIIIIIIIMIITIYDNC